MFKIIQNRMEERVNEEILDEQAGFRRGSGTRDQIANIKWLMKRSREFNQDLIL